MLDSYRVESIVTNGVSTNDLLFLVVTIVAIAAVAALAVFAVCFLWFRREQRRWQKKMLRAIAESNRDPEEIFLTGRDAMTYGELIAQFKVNQGKQVVSVLESDGKRYIHVLGDLSPNERSKMVRYLKSEGFVS